MEDLNRKEIILIIDSLKVNAEHIASVIRSRKTWKWEKEKDSLLCEFATEEDFKKYVEDLNNADLKKMQDLEDLKEKLYNF